MSRKKREWYPGAIYHVMSRGNRRGALYKDDEDYITFLMHVDRVRERYPFKVHACCLMTNHFHMLIETMEENFGVTVDVTLEIDFDGFETLIDLLDGVDIDLTAEEAGHMNRGHGWSLTEGTNHLNGEQALAYSRIRKLDSDFGRTERQRNVLTALMQKYRSASLQEMLNVADAFLDQSTSNRTDNELLGYALELYPTLAEASLVSHQVPAEGTWNYVTIRGMSVISVDLEENSLLLKELLEPADAG